MEFSLNLINIVPEMGNRWDEAIEDIDPTYELAWELVHMLASGELEFRVEHGFTGYFLVLDVPDELLEKYGYEVMEVENDYRNS